jgi:riboflavin synthase
MRGSLVSVEQQMFTGIIQTVGKLVARREQGGDCVLTVAPGSLDQDNIGLGDSIAVNGVCLTVVAQRDGNLDFDVSAETLGLTTIGGLQTGASLNLETAATPATALGGHIVSGHVDGLATIKAITPDARSFRVEVNVPRALARYLAQKGSVCVDGVSLTINGIGDREFDVNIVPHTMDATIFGSYVAGTIVNLEVDVIARYVERLIDARGSANDAA